MQLSDMIFELALKRSFFFPSNEAYGAIAGFYEYGPVGVLIKHKIENLWRETFIKSEGFHEVETSLITPEPVLVASGHVSSFADPVVECQKCKTRVRADSLAEEKHYSLHGEKWDGKLESLDRVMDEKKITCPKCKGAFGKCFMFNLMFQTGIGGERTAAYSRPETAQGIFTAFPRIFKNHGTKLPLAVGQVGKSFRNEISPRKGLVRMREFTQMELEYFFNPSEPNMEKFEIVKNMELTMGIKNDLRQMTTSQIVEEKVAANQIMAYFLARQWEFYKKVGINEKKMYLRVLDSQEVPHYSKGNIDMEVETSFGKIETIGNAYRTDFDLTSHTKHSGQDFSVFVESEKKKVMPHVFELSMGVDRTFYCILEHCFRDKDQKDENGNWKLGTGKEWEWFDFPPVIAPYHVAVFPLMTKDGLDKKAEEIAESLRSSGLDVAYRDSGSIGRRYARNDEIGVPYALTVDYDSLKDGTTTIRYRNDGKQERIKISDCEKIIKENVKNGKVSL
ncbi:Proline--tRNA ligase [Candidatus Bilamarchaeum dharawalense]|uniref:glycine--tRNA ligase n=1 Tax=Candidatus Bilamarchaeum dharawalense TaxID=2885759 RepID=A0A5E4LPU6_9ARCH|nr:Proline--tRNA ligase [Candidatus Bilamarchaeum dharawalense]